MMESLDFLREFTFPTVILRLVLAMAFGGIIGLEGARKGRPAGFRTYILVCLGAALTMLLGQYELELVKGITDSQPDVARFSAQVVNGIGFLGAGTIIVTGKQQIKGLTTAAGLWACACVGIAIGAGFYEGVLLALMLVFLIVKVLPALEDRMVHNMRNMNIYVEYDRITHTGAILNQIRSLGARIYEVEIDRREEEPGRSPSAVFTIRLDRKRNHAQVLAHISRLECISTIEEI